MKKSNGALIGLLFIVVGFLYACKALDIFNFSIFFPGWWTMFIIIPCFYGLFKKGEEKTGPIIGLVIGICFLINAQDISLHIDFWPMILALLCVIIGVKMIFPEKKRKKDAHIEINFGSQEEGGQADFDGSTSQTQYTGSSQSYVNASAIFGGKDIRVDNEIFTGADINVIFGGIDLNLRNAVITEDVYVNVTTIFGGVDISVPAGVRVVTDDCNVILGGVDVSGSYANAIDADAPRVIVSGNCIFGGIEIR